MRRPDTFLILTFFRGLTTGPTLCGRPRRMLMLFVGVTLVVPQLLFR